MLIRTLNREKGKAFPCIDLCDVNYSYIRIFRNRFLRFHLGHEDLIHISIVGKYDSSQTAQRLFVQSSSPLHQRASYLWFLNVITLNSLDESRCGSNTDISIYVEKKSKQRGTEGD